MPEFIYKLIGTPPPGLVPGEYDCEFVKMETKRTKKGALETTVLLRVKKEKKQE
jgi:hypothetical protein